MKEKVLTTVRCQRINNGKVCNKLPRLICAGQGLYYAVCSCAAHNANFGRYQFLGMTPKKAIKRWEDFHLHGNDHFEEDIKKLERIFELTKEQAYEFKNRHAITTNKNSRGQVRPKHYSVNYRRKKCVDSGERKTA